MWKTLCISFAIVLALLVSFALARTFDGVFTEKAAASEDKKMEELWIPGEILLECLVSLERAKKGVSIIFNGIGEHDHYSVARGLIVRVERDLVQVSKTPEGGDFWIVPISSVRGVMTFVGTKMNQ
jgi:hypothetical protein